MGEKNLCKKVVLGANPSASQDEIDYVYWKVWVKIPFHYNNFRKSFVCDNVVTNGEMRELYECMMSEAHTDKNPLDALLVGVGIDRDNTYYYYYCGRIREFRANFKGTIL